MAEKITTAARAAAAAGTEIVATTSASGPTSIEGYYDEAMSVPGLLAEIAQGGCRSATTVADGRTHARVRTPRWVTALLRDTMLITRVVALVEAGKLLADGDPRDMRSCRVRLPG